MFWAFWANVGTIWLHFGTILEASWGSKRYNGPPNEVCWASKNMPHGAKNSNFVQDFLANTISCLKVACLLASKWALKHFKAICWKVKVQCRNHFGLFWNNLGPSWCHLEAFWTHSRIILGQKSPQKKKCERFPHWPRWFWCDFVCDFSIQNLTLVQIQNYQKSSKILGFYNSFCTSNHVGMCMICFKICIFLFESFPKMVGVLVNPVC